MREKTALVTGAGGDIGQGVIKCLKETGYSIRLIGCDVDPYAAGRNSVDRFYRSPHAGQVDEYCRFIAGLVSEEKIDYIFPTTEAEIELYDADRSMAGSGVTVFIHEAPVIRTFLDKYETVNFLKGHGLPHPRTFLLEKYNGELPFPVFIKPRKGWGGKGLVTAHDAEELAFYKKRMKGAIVQEIVGAPEEEYTVGLFSTGKDAYSIAFKRCLGYGSLTKVAQLIQDDDIKAIAEKIARALALEGSLNIQMRKTPAGYVPFEINPRFSSTVYTRSYFGFQDVKWWIDLKEKRSVEYKPKYRNGVAVRTVGETFFGLEGR